MAAGVTQEMSEHRKPLPCCHPFKVTIYQCTHLAVVASSVTNLISNIQIDRLNLNEQTHSQGGGWDASMSPYPRQHRKHHTAVIIAPSPNLILSFL